MIKIDSPTKGATNAHAVITRSSVGTSEWYLIPNGVLQILVELITDGATASVETSNNYIGVVNGTAIGVAWDEGEVSENKSVVCSGCAGIRLITSTGGTAKVYVTCIMA